MHFAALIIDSSNRINRENLSPAISRFVTPRLPVTRAYPSQYGIRFETDDEAEAFVRQMAAEVQKRLDSISMVGHSITTKVMKRDPTAPIEPAKVIRTLSMTKSH